MKNKSSARTTKPRKPSREPIKRSAFRSIKLRRFLSFDNQHGVDLALLPLNVLIGANASGKSNLIEAFAVLRALASRGALQDYLSKGGGVREWLWKPESIEIFGQEPPVACLGVEIDLADLDQSLAYDFSFTHDERLRLTIFGEKLEATRAGQSGNGPSYFVRGVKNQVEFYGSAKPRMNSDASNRKKPADTLLEVGAQESVLSAFRDPRSMPIQTRLADFFSLIRIYRDFSLGSVAALSRAQRADEPAGRLAEDGSNLLVVLHQLLDRDDTNKSLHYYIKKFYDDFEQIKIILPVSGVFELIVRERGDREISPFRLSSGTLRWLCLLAILLDPYPAPLTCIEEPELGLHPDIMNTLAELLIDASRRTQLIVTTHSDHLVSALTGCPESVVVCEHPFDATTLERLDETRLEKWLDEYRLGQLWMQGELGGTRW